MNIVLRSATRPRVAVVGAGMGGLSAAVHLAAGGAHVTLFESSDRLGGKARAQTVGDAGGAVDAGPTVLTLPEVFRDLFAAAGEHLEEHVVLHAAEVLARHFFPDGARLDLFADQDRSASAISEVFGSNEAEGFRRFARHVKGLHQLVDGPFLKSQRPTLLGTIRSFGLSALTDLVRIDGLRTLSAALEDFFETPHLRQLFGRYATYVGSSPLAAPATLAVIAGVEFAGVYRVEGGIRRLVDAIGGLAARLGVEIRLGAFVEEIVVDGRSVAGVRLAGGERRAFDAVVIAAEAGALVEGRFGPSVAGAVSLSGVRSLSAFTLTGLVSVGPGGPAMTHHNVFFGADGPGEFEALFDERRLSTDPTLYVCAQDRDATSSAPPARTPERVLALINAPPLQESFQPCREPSNRTTPPSDPLTAQMTRWGLYPVSAATSTLTGPADWARTYPGSAGALYGQASHGWRQAFLRPSARTRVPGLYLAGGSAHPGAGLPMAATSGALAASALWADLPST